MAWALRLPLPIPEVEANFPRLYIRTPRAAAHERVCQ